LPCCNQNKYFNLTVFLQNSSDMLSLGLPALHIAPFFLYNNINQVSTVETIDSQEQCFEVPHWMHLSFASYESDKTVFVKNRDEGQEDEEDPLLNRFTGIEVRANGFLLPRVIDAAKEIETPSSPLLRSTSIPSNVHSSAPTNPTTVTMSSARQLIAGRDFRDILDACRPRNAAVVPSPLRAILEFQACGPDQPKQIIHYLSEVVNTNQNCSEWGSCEFNSLMDDSALFYRRRAVSLGQDPSENLPNIAALSPRRFDGPSSMASHVSSSILGSSYDRPYLSNQATTSLMGFQLQTPAFLDYSMIEDDECGSDGDLSEGNSSDDESGPRRPNFEDKLRRMMDAHDSSIAAFVSPHIVTSDESREINEASNRPAENSRRQGNQALRPELLARSRSRNSTKNIASGGIGAALQQHSTKSAAPSFHGEAEAFNTSVSRMPSIGRNSLTPTVRQMADMGSRGLSPLFLPPAANIIENPEFQHNGRLSLERRLVDPQDFASNNISYWKPRRRTGILTGSRLKDISTDVKGQQNHLPSARSSSFSPPTDRKQGNASVRHIFSGKPQTTGAGRKTRNKLVKKAFNPFRQQDEEEVLAKRSHNRRRWSQ
jgi:hypothetical protein